MTSYEHRGVSPDKPDLHTALAQTGGGLFPGAFCHAVPDILGGSDEHCVILHADGAGSKSALAYLYYCEHGDPRVFRGIAQDALVMNLDDLLCVGATGPFVLSNIIGRNASIIGADILTAIIDGYVDCAQFLKEYGIEIVMCGGETADVGDLVRTVTVDATLATRIRRADFIDCSKVTPGLSIVGLASFGRAVYESEPNSGISTNGFTAARHELLGSTYKAVYPETFSPDIAELAYVGDLTIDSPLAGTASSVGGALLSPTRTYAPVVARVLDELRSEVKAIFHNTGGGQTKCLRFGNEMRYVKDDLFDPPPIFRLMQKASSLSQREMLRVFNMGHRLEIVCSPAACADIVSISRSFAVDAKVVGRTERSPGGNELLIELAGEKFFFHR